MQGMSANEDVMKCITSVYRGKGRLSFSDTGIDIEGGRVYSVPLQFTIWLTLTVAIFYVFGPLVGLIGVLGTFWIVEYVLFKKAYKFIDWESLGRWIVITKDRIIGVSFAEGESWNLAILRVAVRDIDKLKIIHHLLGDRVPDKIDNNLRRKHFENEIKLTLGEQIGREPTAGEIVDGTYKR